MKAELVQAASKVITSPEILVNMVSRRVRQLALGHRPLVVCAPGLREADIALTEIANGKLTLDNPRLALIAIAGVFAILNADITMVNVALVTLSKHLHADLEDLQWGLISYMLAFAALIVAAGRVADVFGRRRCLLAGAIVFAIASLLCGVAPTLSVLVIGRVLQGAGGALMLPAGMAIISSVYNAEERAAALGTLVGIAGVAQSIGPLLGGFLTAQVSWRLVFFINLPLIAVIVIIALRAI